MLTAAQQQETAVRKYLLLLSGILVITAMTYIWKKFAELSLHQLPMLLFMQRAVVVFLRIHSTILMVNGTSSAAACLNQARKQNQKPPLPKRKLHLLNKAKLHLPDRKKLQLLDKLKPRLLPRMKQRLSLNEKLIQNQRTILTLPLVRAFLEIRIIQSALVARRLSLRRLCYPALMTFLLVLRKQVMKQMLLLHLSHCLVPDSCSCSSS